MKDTCQVRNAALHRGQQEDIHEGLTLFLDMIGGGVDKLFHIRYKCTIQCIKCKKLYNSGDSKDHQEPPETMIDLTHHAKVLDTQLAVENHIKQTMNVPDGYKCDKCGAKNEPDADGKMKVSVLQIYTLCRLSEIITIIFKKYHSKEETFFPQTLSFGTKTGKTQTYKIVAVADHYGTMTGGHYTATALRNKPVTLHNDRRIKIEKALAEEERLYNQAMEEVRMWGAMRLLSWPIQLGHTDDYF